LRESLLIPHSTDSHAQSARGLPDPDRRRASVEAVCERLKVPEWPGAKEERSHEWEPPQAMSSSARGESTCHRPLRFLAPWASGRCRRKQVGFRNAGEWGGVGSPSQGQEPAHGRKS